MIELWFVILERGSNLNPNLNILICEADFEPIGKRPGATKCLVARVTCTIHELRKSDMIMSLGVGPGCQVMARPKL